MPRQGESESYPAARERAEPGPGISTPGPYDVAQASAEVVSANADVEVIRFAGAPHAITLSVRGFPAVFTLQDEMGVELGELLLEVDATYTTHARAVRVLVRNAVPGSNALVAVVGTWERGPRG